MTCQTRKPCMLPFCSLPDERVFSIHSTFHVTLKLNTPPLSWSSPVPISRTQTSVL
uniref:Uncharacterized protein n=1 Tax=Anguilla anguilla TaxID=7936 RepID=A0A0E9S2D7_ANGAN